jgi:hypothetical protein
MSDAGALLFARYAYPPNALGFCGADEPRTLLEHAHAGEADGGLTELARTFEGAWPYLTLIAGASGLSDPLDLRVVEAYWVGNELLDRVPPRELARHVEERFGRRLGRALGTVTDAAAAGALPHHCFHVFVVYPWLGLLRGGVVTEPLRVLDRCRITPARVLRADGDELEVLARPLVWDASRLALAAPRTRRVRWREDGLALVARPEPGELVSLHWDVACDRLTPAAAARLQAATARALSVVASADPRRGPDAASPPPLYFGVEAISTGGRS